MDRFKRNDTVTGWFGVGTVTDAPEFDNVVRVVYRDRGKVKYAYVPKKDIAKA